MAQQQNVEQIVRSIIDVLSESVSELVLMVVVLREQNAQMPASLPKSSAGVNETARKLGLIAKKLAATDYKDFPEISDEINEASDSLDSATQVLGKAVTDLTGGVTRQGWDNLVEACRVMSGKTIRLLQIVYGAPMKRLKINADRLANQINNFDAHPKGLKDQKNQQKLLDDIKPLTEKALRLEKHLNDRAKVADSPQAKQQLQEAAQDARKAAQNMVDAVNDAIKNHPDDADLGKPLEDLRRATEGGRELSEKTAPPAPKGIPEPRKGAPSPYSGPKTLAEDIKEAKEMARAVPDLVKKDPASYPDAHDRLKDKVEQIRKKTPAPISNPEKWNDAVEKPLLNQLKAGRDVVKAPNNPATKRALDDATNDLVKALDDVEAKSKPPAPSGNGPISAQPAPGAPALRKGAPATPAAQKQEPGAQAPKDRYKRADKPISELAPEDKKRLFDNIKKVASPELAAAIPPEKKPKFERAKLKDNLDELKHDVKLKNSKPAAQHAKQAEEAAKQLAKTVKDDLAKNPDQYTPEERKQKEDAVQAIEKALPEFVNAAQHVVNNPSNPEAAKALDDQMKKIRRAADRAAPKPGPPAQVSKPDWRKAKEDMQKAVEEAKKPGGYKRAAKKAIEDAEKPIERVINPNPGRGLLDRDPAAGPSDELQKLWDKFRNAADRGDPNAMDALIPQMEEAYRNLAEVPQNAADRLADAVDAVNNAVKNGDPNPPIADLEDAFEKFINDTQKDPSPEVRAAATRAAEDLAPKLADFIKKAQEAAKNPNDKRKAQAVEAAVPPIKKPIDDFKNAIKPLDKEFEKAKEDMKKVADAVKKGYTPEAKKAIEKLAEKPFGRNWQPQKGPGLLPPSDPDGPSDELKRLWDKFRNAGNRGDPNTMEKVIPEIDRNVKKVLDPPKKAANDVENAVNKMVDAANGRGDPEDAAEQLRDAVEKLEDEAKANPSPEVREAARDAVDAIRPFVDDLIRKADDAARHPQDKAKAQAAQKAANDVKKPVQNFKDKLKPIENAVEKAKEDMKKAAQAVKKGDKPAAKQALEKLAEKPFGTVIDPPSNAPPPEDPAEELEKLWDDVKDAVDRGDADAIERAIPEIEKQYQKAAERPKKAADRVKEALDDLADAINDPTHTPFAPGAPIPPGSRIPDAIRDLQDAVDDFARLADEDPSPEVREEAKKAAEAAKPLVEEAIKKAVEAIKAPQDKRKAEEAVAATKNAHKPIDAFKDAIKPLDDKFNKNKDEIKKIADQVKKGYQREAKKAAEALQPKPFGRNFTPGKGKGLPPPDGSDGPSDELKKLWDRFRNAAKKGDAPAMERAIPEMAKAYQAVADKPKNAADKLKKAIDDVAKAAQEGNPYPPLKHLDKAVKDFINDTQSDPSPEVREAGAKAADALFPLINDLVDKANDAVQNPQKAQQVASAAAQAKKPVDAFKEKIAPLDNAFKKNQDEMKKAVDAVKKGQKPVAKKIIDDIAEKPFGRNFTPGKGKGLPPPDPSTGPSDELKKLWDRFKNGAKKGDVPLMEKTIPEIDRAFNKVAEERRAEPLAAADKLEQAIDDAVAAADNDRPIPLKEIKDALDNFQNAAQSSPDPQVQYAGEKAVEEFKPEFAELIKAAKDVMENPKNPEKARVLQNQAQKAKQPIKNFKVEAVPNNPEDAAVVDKQGGEVKDALNDLKNAVKAQKKTPEVKKALDRFKDALGDFNNNIHDVAKNTEDPGKSDYLDRKADELDDILDKVFNLDPQNPELLDVIDIVPDVVDDIFEHLSSDPADDAIEAAARATNLTAFLETVDEDDLDLGDLLDTANDLADLMKGLIGETNSVADEFSSSPDVLNNSAKAAKDLGDLLKELESGAYADEDAEAYSAKLDQLRGTPDNFEQPTKTLAEATSFEDIAAAVAYNIKKQCDEQSELVSKTGGSVAKELAALASAARKGEKTQMLMAAKAASAHIAALSKEILALAQKIPAKNAHERSIQDHLIRCSQGLTNYGTQLKILTSVKAASIEEARDTDEALSTIATDLGDIISQALNSMAITNSTILRAK